MHKITHLLVSVNKCIRKSHSLAPQTRQRLITSVCEAIKSLCEILSNRQSSSSTSSSDAESSSDTENDERRNLGVVPQKFRDTLAYHVYMLYNIMCFSESEAKLQKQQSSMRSKSKGKRNKNSKSASSDTPTFDSIHLRKQCATTMLDVAESMSEYKSILWKCGVPDENVVSLPFRIACQMIESASTAQARKTSNVDDALKMIAATVVSADFSSMSTLIAALMDLLHSYEHVAPLVAELCCLISAKSSVNRLAVSLIQEIGRSNFTVGGNTDHAANGEKASGVRNVAPFISELASLRPRIVLDNMIHILPLLNCEPYILRNSVVYAIGHIVARYPQEEEKTEAEEESSEENESGSSIKNQHMNKTRDSLLDVLIERTHDKSSYTRSAVLKVWAQLSESNSIPLDRLMPVTELAVDRLQDMSVNVRSKAMKVNILMISYRKMLRQF